MIMLCKQPSLRKKAWNKSQHVQREQARTQTFEKGVGVRI